MKRRIIGAMIFIGCAFIILTTIQYLKARSSLAAQNPKKTIVNTSDEDVLTATYGNNRVQIFPGDEIKIPSSIDTIRVHSSKVGDAEFKLEQKTTAIMSDEQGLFIKKQRLKKEKVMKKLVITMLIAIMMITQTQLVTADHGGGAAAGAILGTAAVVGTTAALANRDYDGDWDGPVVVAPVVAPAWGPGYAYDPYEYEEEYYDGPGVAVGVGVGPVGFGLGF